MEQLHIMFQYFYHAVQQINGTLFIPFTQNKNVTFRFIQVQCRQLNDNISSILVPVLYKRLNKAKSLLPINVRVLMLAKIRLIVSFVITSTCFLGCCILFISAASQSYFMNWIFLCARKRRKFFNMERR